MIVGLIDYGMGNLRSVRNALVTLGARVDVVDRGEALADVDAVVVPGVGAFGEGMRGLRERGFVEALDREVRQRGKPMLGICLGLQLLATRGYEQGEHSGLTWVAGDVRRFDRQTNLRIPHVGWNGVDGTGVLFRGIPRNTDFYFVHSFHFVLERPSEATATANYGEPFVAALERENILAVQFHPEKSHKYGLVLLKNFLDFASARA
ncbi:MAG: imidazole glycerol phosphate synthase subunit HisH [Labilithrix sp.]|nr:imidazole glycerol phosphate synthase subunit HisH [Labilithrix sp.]